MKKLILLIGLLFVLIGCEAQQGNLFWSYSSNTSPYFIFTVNIPSDGTSVTLPLTNLSSPTHNFVVNYGDGTIATVTAYNDADATHVYNTGIYQIKMIGVCNEFKTQDTSNIRTYITSVDNWGLMGFNRLDFNGCTNLITLPQGAITGARTVSTYLQFCLNCISLTAIPEHLFDESVDYLLTNSAFSQAFQGCTSLTTTSSGGATNLSTSQATSTVTVNSDTGTDAIIPAATQSLAGVLNTVDKTKIDNIWVTTPQSLSGTTVTMTWTSGINASITLTGTTTLTIEGMPDGGESQIEVTNGSSSYTFNLNGSTGYTTEVIMGNNATINTTISSHTTVVIWRRGSTLYYGFVYDN